MFERLSYLIIATAICVAALLPPLAFGQQLEKSQFVRVVQSSNASSTNGALLALDANIATSSLTANAPGSYWLAELGRPFPLDRIEVVNRPAPSDAELGGLKLRLFNIDDQVVFENSNHESWDRCHMGSGLAGGHTSALAVDWVGGKSDKCRRQLSSWPCLAAV